MAAPNTNDYDVFISCSEEDQEWVDTWLLPRLEGEQLRTIVGDRDFEIGTPTLINIERAIEHSRRTIVVLTPAWLDSEWNTFEALLVQSADPAARQRKLLPLLLKPCEPPARIASLQAVDFRIDRFWERQSRRLVRGIADIVPVDRPWVTPGGIREPERWKRWLWRYRREIRRSILGIAVVWLLLAMALQLPPFFDPREGWQDTGFDAQQANAWRLIRAGGYLFVATTIDNRNGCASQDTGLWRQNPLDASWSALTPPLNMTTAKGCVRAQISALAASPAESGTIFASTFHGGLLRSDDAGDHWTVVNSLLLPKELLAVVMTPAFPHSVFVAGWDLNLYASTDDGTSWTQINGAMTCRSPAEGVTLPATLKVGALLATADAIYVGTDRIGSLYPSAENGLYASTDGGNCWKLLDSAGKRYTYKALIQIPNTKDEVLALTYDTLAASKGEAKYHLWRLSGDHDRTSPLWESLYVVQTIAVTPGAVPTWYAAGNLGDVYRGPLESNGPVESLHPFAFQARCFFNTCFAGMAPDSQTGPPLLLTHARVYRRALVPWYRRFWP